MYIINHQLYIKENILKNTISHKIFCMILEEIATFFSNNVFLATLIIALIPGLEGRIAIPFALSTQLFAENTLTPVLAYLSAFLGSIIPCIPIVFLTRKFKNKYFTNVSKNKFQKKITQISKSTSTLKKIVLLSTFVAIPLPMTGVWSGSIIAGFTSLKIWQCFLAISIGSAIACSIILIICIFFENSTLQILYFSLCLLAIFVIVELISSIKRKNASK